MQQQPPVKPKPDLFISYKKDKQNVLPLIVTQQKSFLGCGSNAAVMVMKAFNKPMTHEQIDKKMRRLGTFTAPGMMKRFFKKQGLHAKVFNHSSFEEIKKAIDNKNYVVPLHARTKESPIAHYEVICGYEIDGSGKKYLLMSKRYHEDLQKVSYEDFQLLWNNLKMYGLPTGYDNMMVVVSDNKDIATRRKELPFITNTVATTINWTANTIAKTLDTVFGLSAE